MKSGLSNLGYQLDPDTRVWSLPGYAGIPYNDGDETERRIAAAIAQAGDVSVLSDELSRHCTDWPSLYHLSGSRANILRPFDGILKNADVLEIGAGCGAITRHLGECGANVLALEGSPRRAAIARARARDLPNVAVVTDRFEEFRWDGQFDVVTLIGVLEYANVFSEAEEPALAMLSRARSLLKPDGRLIIAIENQLGLKYFAGAPEDHLGKPMYGIEGRYRKDQPHTYSRKVLTALLRRAGFAFSEFLAPFPDYKLPASIITEAGLADPDFDAAAFAWQSVRRDPQFPPYCHFSPELAWQPVFEGGLALDLANSFLVSASPRPTPQSERNVLAHHYSTDRVSRYCKETRFFRDAGDRITVCYRPLGDVPAGSAESPAIRAHWPEEAAYVPGTPLSREFLQLISRDGWTIREAGAFIQRHVRLLESLTAQSGLPSPRLRKRLPGAFLDAVPSNILIDRNGMPALIDQEWSVDEDIELERLLFRSLLWMTGGITSFGKNPDGPRTRGEFVKAALKAAGYPLTDEEVARFTDQEASIQQAVTGRSAREFLAGWINQPLPHRHLSAVLEERDRRLACLEKELAAHIRENTEREKRVSELHGKAAEREELIARQNQVIAARDMQIAAMHASTSWRITQPLRIVGGRVKRGRSIVRRIFLAIERSGGFRAAAEKALRAYRRDGMEGILRAVRTIAPAENAAQAAASGERDERSYAEWIRRFDTPTGASRASMRARIESFPSRPLISIVMPTYNPKPEWLEEAIDSVRRQIYPHWELCIADDASTDPAIRAILERHAGKDARIKIVFRDKNGHISASSNTALQLAGGDWIALLDHDDLLAEHALYWVAHAINRHPRARLIYSDEDKIDENGRRFSPYFKCDWNADLFYSHNLITHLGVYRTELVKEVGGFREGLEGAQDYDLALRCIEHLTPQEIHHIPRVLYHWRMHALSTAYSAEAKPYAVQAGRRALSEHFQRRGIKAGIECTGYGYRVQYALPEALPLVSLIIPTRNAVHLMRNCIGSILGKTEYPNYEIIVVDNGSDDPEALRYFAELAENPRIRIIRDDRPFNYSALNNAAAALAKGEILGLLNNDVEVISSGWLTEMVSHAVRPGVGAVGAKLYYPDDTLQHGGVILGIGGVAGHVHGNLPRGAGGYFSRACILQSLSAVTAACLLVRKAAYEEVGGLNETDLRVAFNDIDFCLRLREAGYRNVWTPYAELYHHESATRGYENTPEKRARFAGEVRYMQQRWAGLLLNDPAYNPNLTLERGDFGLAWPPRVEEIEPPRRTEESREAESVPT